MDDAFAEGKVIGKAAFGYMLVPRRDVNGRVIYKANGKVLNDRILDKKAVKMVLKVASLLVDQFWNPSQIARWCNEHKVAGRQTWNWNTVVLLLTLDSYVGHEFYRKTQIVLDPETGRLTTVKFPKEKWKRREVPHLRIFSDELRARIDERLRRVGVDPEGKPRTRSKTDPGRAGLNGKALVRPLCGVCMHELWLGRAGKYASFCCLNGKDGKHGCSLRTYKAVGIVEDAILEFLWATLSSPEFVRKVVEEANAFLAKEAKLPRADSKAIERAVRRLDESITNLVTNLEGPNGHESKAIEDRIRENEAKRDELKEKLRIARLANQEPPAPLTQEAVEDMLRDLRGVLSRDVPEAAAILRELTGPIVVTQEAKVPGRRGTDWTARFTLNFVPVALVLAARKACPTSATWDPQNRSSGARREPLRRNDHVIATDNANLAGVSPGRACLMDLSRHRANAAQTPW
jgi:site-specific DNA recombinase